VSAAAPVAVPPPPAGRRRCRPGGRGADRVHRDPCRRRRQEDQRDQGDPHHHRPRPQGSQGPGRGRARRPSRKACRRTRRTRSRRCWKRTARRSRSSDLALRPGPAGRGWGNSSEGCGWGCRKGPATPPVPALPGRRAKVSSPPAGVVGPEQRGKQDRHERYHEVVHRAQADPQELRASPRGRADAEPHRRAARLLRSLPADGGEPRQPDHTGLQEVFKSVFPIDDFAGVAGSSSCSTSSRSRNTTSRNASSAA
jgi:hypothetical protein